MLPTDLSATELARMTGLAIDATWNCATRITGSTRVVQWTAPQFCAEEILAVAPSVLPVLGALRVEWRIGEVSWNENWPLAFDFHWLREITRGFPLGTRPVRVRCNCDIPSTVRLKGPWASLIWRDQEGRTRVLAVRGQDANWRVEVAAPVDPVPMAPTRPVAPTRMDELMRAFTGSTSVEWLRGLFADSCSLRWKELAERIGARPDQLDDLSTYFRALTTTEEDAIWRASESADGLAKLQQLLGALAAGELETFQERLREDLERQGVSFWRGVTGEWLNAVAGEAPASWSSAETAARLEAAARRLLSLLIRDDLASLLVLLRAQAEQEWASLAPWYRRRIEESCGALSETTRSETASSGNVLEEVSLWMKKLHQRLHLQAADAARTNARNALSAAFASSVKGCDGMLPLAEFLFDATQQGDAALERILDGDWRPCFDSEGAAKLIGGPICETLGRRISLELLLPFLSKKAWTLARQGLSDAEIRQTGNGQLSVRRMDEVEARNSSREDAALLLSAVFTSRLEAPADDMIHMVHEDRRSLQGNECDASWHRLIRAYGLPSPQLPSTPCEATLRIEVPWNWSEAWCNAPLKRDAGYLDKFMQLSLTMQEMTRHWLPALCLTSPARFDAPNNVLPLLVYAASQACVERKQAEFGYATMSPNMVQRAAASASARLPEILAPLYQSLQASGRTRTAEFYSPDRAKLIISAVQRQPKALATLLAGDTFLLEYCFQIAGMCRELRAVAGRNPAQALKKLGQFSDEIAKACQRGMRKIYPDESYRGLGTIYLLEATRVLAGGSIQSGLRASLTLETSTGMRRYEAAA